MSRKNHKKRRFSFFKLALVALILILAAGALLAYFPVLLFSPPAVAAEEGPEAEGGIGDISSLLRGETVNIALLGFDGAVSPDKEQNIYRPDTILIAAINFRSGQVSLVSIPRDSYVKIHGTDIYDKINHSFMYGHYRAGEGENRYESGIETTLRTVVDFLGGIPLHGYVVVDLKGAESIIDSIGGIYYDVEVEVRDDFGRGRLLVEEGYQRLDGKKFMDYVRNRAGFQGGERGRTERQQDIMIALLDQFKEPANIPRIPGLYRAVKDNTDTELSFSQVLALGLLGLRVNPDQIETAVFSGSGQLSYRDGQNIWYLVIDEQERVNIIERIFGAQVAQRSQLTLPGPVTPEPEEPEPEPEPEPTPDPEPEIDEEEEKDEPDPDQPEENGEKEPEEEEKEPGDPEDPEEEEDEETDQDPGADSDQNEQPAPEGSNN